MKIKLSIFAVLLTAILVVPAFAFFPITPTEPHDADSMWVEHSSYTFDTSSLSIGSLFNISVCLNMSVPTFAYQVALLYNYTWLRCTRGDFTGPTGTSMFMLGHSTTTGYDIDGAILGPGSILAAEACKGTDIIPGNATNPHSGTLIWAEFNVTLAPDKGLNFTDKFDITTKYPAKTWVTTTGNVLTPITTWDSSILYKWLSPTTKPFMGIEHDSGFGSFPPDSAPPATWPLVWANAAPSPGLTAVGSGFNALIYVKQIDPAWHLQNVTFTLTYNSTVIDALGGFLNITVDSAWTVVNSYFVPGEIDYNLTGFSGSAPALPNKVLVATVKFTALIQLKIPPAPSGWFDSTYLTFSNVLITDHTLVIDKATPEQGRVIINALITLPQAYLYVDFDSAIKIIGPDPSIGKVFSAAIKVGNLTKDWHIVAIQTRLSYDDSVLELLSVTEGPFIPNPIWNLYPGPPNTGTFWYDIDNIGGDLVYPFTHVMLVDLLFPNKTTGIYTQPVLPNTLENTTVDPTLATFSFKVLQQNCFGMPNITTALNILPFWKPTDKTFIDRDANYVVSLPGQNGTVIIVSLNEVERQIDLVGGAVNDGYGALPLTWPFPYSPPPYYTPPPNYLAFPSPYGGQGPMYWDGKEWIGWMDLVFPQSQVYLNAYVTYNYWPVQQKDVGFEIEGPYEHVGNTGNFTLDYIPKNTHKVWAKFTSVTDPNGVATYTYRMPWPCDNPDGITGVWKITATVTIADQVVVDTMLFYYERLVYITDVTTDSYSYIHDQYVKVTVDYETHSAQLYPALFAVVITDNLTVPFGIDTSFNTMVGGATFCTWLPGEFTVSILIPKWAFAGNGSVHVSVYDKDPTIGGEALAPEFKPNPIINIYPY